MNNEIKVTVYLSTFNQEKYIREALDSILMQETNFPFELLVADDCSTDRTQEIVLEYQKKYPDLIRTYFTPVNVGGCRKLTECIGKGLFRGEYIANLEGDDYWLEKDRLQVLTDFLDQHPGYSRVSHKRRIINSKGEEKGFDISQNVLNRDFYIEDFLAGKNYSDFGSVFRNYYKESGDKYFPLLLASRNVCDFQDMFITQDFGPVFVMDRCFGVYRSVSEEGASNYNSITTQEYRCRERIRLAKVVEEFYQGRYDLSPMIGREERKLMDLAVERKDRREILKLRNEISEDSIFKALSEILFFARRKKDAETLHFVKKLLTGKGKIRLFLSETGYYGSRVIQKITGKRPDLLIRGTVMKAKEYKQ